MRFPVLVLALLVAGCASAPVENHPLPDPAPPVLEDALAAYVAGNTTANLEVLGQWENSGEEIDAWQDYLFVDSGNTIHILHRVNGSFEVESVAEVAAVGPKDVKVSDDGQWMFLGNDEQASMAPLGGEVRSGGFYTYFIGDKANPELTHYLPVGPTRGPHMVFYHQQADGTELVFGANGDISINRFDRKDGSLSELARYAPDYVTDVNRDPMVIDAYYQVYAHDMFVMEDAGPADDDPNRTLMYVANWDAGLRIVDVTDPASPQELGAWNDFPDGHSGNLHTVATEWIGDRRITVGSVEVGFDIVGGVPYLLNEEKSVLYVWDTTDPSAVELLSVWENPGGVPPGQGGYAAGVTGDQVLSTHNFQLEQGIVYLAHYGLGVFVLDLRTPEAQASPELLAYHEVGNTWDVIVAGGTVVSSGNYGLVGMGFPLLERGPEGLFSRA